MTNKDRINEACKIIEGWRYKFEIPDAVKVFIAHWAYQHVGVFPVESNLLKDERFMKDSAQLSELLSANMLNGENDTLATILTQFCQSDSKSRDYYPTPEGVSKILSGIMFPDALHTPNSIYEPCVGTAGIIMDNIEKIYMNNLHLDEPLKDLSVVVEDISAISLQSFFIQLMYKLNYLEDVGKKPSAPKSVGIYQIDVLSRERVGKIQYELLNPRYAA